MVQLGEPRILLRVAVSFASGGGIADGLAARGLCAEYRSSQKRSQACGVRDAEGGRRLTRSRGDAEGDRESGKLEALRRWSFAARGKRRAIQAAGLAALGTPYTAES